MKLHWFTTLGILTLAAVAGSAQTTPPINQRDSKIFKGCLQGDSAKGFALLAATGDGSGGDQKGQTSGAGGSGKPGVDNATYYANGTLTAKTVREIAPTCAVRSAPDNDKKAP
jgi:hypothetical protein